MEISFETAQLVHEAIAYTITKTSYFTTGQIPSADDVNSATRVCFSVSFWKMKRILQQFGKKGIDENGN